MTYLNSSFSVATQESKQEMKMKLIKAMFLCLKVTQLEELLAVRHSVFVVGGAGTGKSQVTFFVINMFMKPHTR